MNPEQTAQQDPRISLRGVCKIFGSQTDEALSLLDQGHTKEEVQKATGVVVGVHDVSFDIYPGEIFVIMGLSGSGKSTLLRLINRLHDPTRGQILIDGEDITKLSHSALRDLRRRKFGMVFQSFALLPHRTVLSNVEFGLEVQGVERAERRRRAFEAIETVGLSGYENKYPAQLSGGMQQRVGLARALAANSEILLMDEAFSALDPLIRSQLQDDLLEIQDRLGKTIVFVSHDLDEAIKIGTRIAILRGGRLVQVGTAQEILSQPADDYVAAFVRGADCTKVYTAQDIMLPLQTVAYLKDSPRTVLRKMEKSGFDGLVVIDAARRFYGYIKVEDVTTQLKAPVIDPTKLHPLPTANLDTPLAELIQLAAEQGGPIVISDARSRVVGVINKSTLLAVLAETTISSTEESPETSSGDEARSDPEQTHVE